MKWAGIARPLDRAIERRHEATVYRNHIRSFGCGSGIAERQRFSQRCSEGFFYNARNALSQQFDAKRRNVLRRDDGYLMFYIGLRDEEHAQIGIARSKDGITDWQRHRANPVIRPGKDRWDHDAVYKPYAIYDGKKWLLWYNGRRGGVEQIGLATHDGEDLGF